MLHNENKITPRTDPQGFSYQNTPSQGVSYQNPYNQGGWGFNTQPSTPNFFFHPASTGTEWFGGNLTGPSFRYLNQPSLSLYPMPNHQGNWHNNGKWANPWFTPTSHAPYHLRHPQHTGWQGNAEGVERANFFCPPCCVTENNQCFFISCELPGVSEKDIDVLVQNGTVTIRGQKKRRPAENDCEVCINDQVSGQFHRTIYLSEIADCIDCNKISTKWNNGILELTLPKNKQSASSYIKVGSNK